MRVIQGEGELRAFMARFDINSVILRFIKLSSLAFLY